MSILSDLTDNLKEQLKLFEELLAISTEKKNVIIKDDTEMLQKMTDVENVLLSKLTRIENSRMEIVKDIALVTNKKVSDITIESLKTLLKDDDDKKELMEVSKKVNDILKDIKNTNDKNNMLIKNSLEYINFSLNVIKSSSSPEFASYNPRDIKKGGKING